MPEAKTIIERLNARKSDSTWDIIAAIGWGTKTTDYDAIGKALRAVFDETAIERLEKEARLFAKDVYSRAEEFEKEKSNNFFRAGDDSWSDATAHIVGLGKEVFDKFMADPVSVRDSLEKIGGDYWYHENFFYSFQD